MHLTCETEDEFIKEQIDLLDSWEEAQQEDTEEPEEEGEEEFSEEQQDVESERDENEVSDEKLQKSVAVAITELVKVCPKMPDKLLKMLEHFKLASEHKQKA